MKPLKRPGALALFALLGFLSGCAATGTQAEGSDYRWDVLTSEEILSLEMTNLYDVVERARPRWLTRRGGDVVVFQGQTLLGDATMLRQFGPQEVYELRYLDGVTASATLPGLGSRFVSGAIILVTSAQERR
ncbi:MAG: hypothetical protein JSV86_03005 [Gemmatimonadota bacterium]|nr:MAG: hypothetical protein JSV86_03005 [Gemmatimonadota bacterium]